MIQYILECIAFQLVFLIIYDLFLKRETFFQWNRAYLIGTYLSSMVLPWIKVEALKTNVPVVFHEYPEYLWNSNDAAVTAMGVQETTFQISWPMMVFSVGVVLTTLFFGYKLYQIYALRKKGQVHYFKDFTQIIVSNSTLAFSFFKSIFLGDEVLKKEHQSILDHELVHIRQKHSYDLLFFELMRIVGWFNPLVYVYQSRVSELHEFIADAKVSKTNKKEQYELLLSQVFQTQNISFINQFFKKSLIKKRIVMLQKTKSRRIYQLKYLLLVPIILGMIFYTSLEGQVMSTEQGLNDQSQNEVQGNADAEKRYLQLLQERERFLLSSNEKNPVIVNLDQQLRLLRKSLDGSLESRTEGFSKNDANQMSTDSAAEKLKQLLEERKRLLKSSDEKNPIIINLDAQIAGLRNAIEASRSTQVVFKDIPFAKVDEVPVFPGCEDDEDTRECFQQKMMRHVSKNFNYPKEAQEKGVQGRVALMFTINEEGLVQNLKLRGPDRLLEKEAARIIKRLPQMTPGKHKGEVVGVTYSIPISFVLDKDENEKSETKSKEEKIESGTPFAIVDEVPVFPGCENEENKRACFNTMMQKHISKNFRYPQKAQGKGIQGRVNLMFIIGKDGVIKNLRMRGPDKLLEDEAKRIIMRLPDMKPGRDKGEKVDVPFSIPITFRLQKQPDDFQFINEEGEILNDKQRLAAIKYNELLKERQRLMKKSKESNEVIESLDEQLEGLKKAIYKKDN